MPKQLPGFSIDKRRRPYGFEGHLNHYGDGDNCLRTVRLAQPRALKRGDILATGDKVLSAPRNGYNGLVWLNLDGDWIEVPARIPIAILTEADQAPAALWQRKIKR